MNTPTSPATDHDPLCRCQHMAATTDPADVSGCDCALIAKVRADEQRKAAMERERIAQALTDLGYDYPAEVARNGGRDE